MRTSKPGERHQRKCHDCGNVAMHDDRVIPWVLCTKCGSQDTRPTTGRIIPPQGGASSAPPAKVATVPREVADRLAEACDTPHLLSLLQHIGSGSCTCDYEVGMAPCETCVAKNAATHITAALDEYRKAATS